MRLGKGAHGAVPLVLVVEDDRDIREVIAEVLALAGYRTCTAPNGRMALEQARVDRPDLIVLDLLMPVMNGWQFMEAQRRDPELATIPVVVVTAALDANAEGAAGFLQKPFDSDALLETTSRLCGRGNEHFLA